MRELSATAGGVHLLKDKLVASGADISGLIRKHSPQDLQQACQGFCLEPETSLRSDVNMWNPHVFTS